MSPRVVRIDDPGIAVGRGPYAGRELYLTRFSLRNTTRKDSDEEIGRLRGQFITYLQSRGGYRAVIDATSGLPAVPAGKDVLTLEAEIELGLQDKRNLLIGAPFIYPMIGYWPFTPRRGSAMVSGSAYLFGPGRQLLNKRSAKAVIPFKYLIYAWYRTQPIEDSFKTAYADVFNRISTPQSQSEWPEPSEDSQSAMPSLASDVDGVKPKPSRISPNDFALIVGIEAYRSVPSARFAERDAVSFRKYAEATLGVPPENIVFLSGSGAGRGDLSKYLEEWLPRNVAKESRIYFFYSGHGAPDPLTGETYLVPWDGDPSFLKTTAYPLARLYDRLNATRAREVVVLLDSCFSGSGGRSVLAKGTRPLVSVNEDHPSRESRVSVIAAARGNEIAGSLEDQGHGIFTYFLLKGIGGGADVDGDGHVTIKELHSYLRPQVERSARRQNRDQTPQLASSMPDIQLY